MSAGAAEPGVSSLSEILLMPHPVNRFGAP